MIRHLLCSLLPPLSLLGLCCLAEARTEGQPLSSRNGLTLSAVRSGPGGTVLHVQVTPDSTRRSEPNSPEATDSDPFSGGFLWALPGDVVGVDATAADCQWREVEPGEIPDSILSRAATDPQPLVRVSSVLSMRGQRMVAVGLNRLQINEQGITRVCQSCQIELHFSGGGTVPRPALRSASFCDLARSMVANLDDVDPVPERRPEAYLVITPPGYATAALNNYVRWKRQRGHTVTLVTTTQTGTTNQQIKDYIQNAYDQWPEPPVFVLLIGDVDGTNAMASWLVPGDLRPFDVSDHPYTLLDGEDYLPDVFVGRLSVDNGSELQTVINKCLNYESQPFQPTGVWRSRMLITGVRSSPGYYQAYNSSWPTLQWIGRQFLEHGYSQVLQVPFPDGTATEVANAVNSGVSFIAYRGFGAPTYWAGPYFDNANVNSLTNGAMLPVVASIVCGGGAFDNDSDPCFGEAWLRTGTPTNPRGAVGFIGPSELDTKTRWNNTNVAGIFEGILFEGVNTLGAAMVRGKLELLYEFPNNADIMGPDADRSVSFYFYCYNLLGDPGLTFFVGPARDLTADVPSTLPLGTPSLSIPVTENGEPLPDVWGTVSGTDTIFCRALSDSLGYITLSFPQATAGTVTVTLTKPLHEPQQYTVTLSGQAVEVAAAALRIADGSGHGSSGNSDGVVNPGESLALGVVLRNFGSSAFAGGTLTVTAATPSLSVIIGTAAVSALGSGAQSDTLWVAVDVAGICSDDEAARLSWSVEPGDFVWQTEFDIHAAVLSVADWRTNGSVGNPEPEQESRVALTLLNSGRATAEACTLTVWSDDPRVIVTDSLTVYPPIPPGGTAAPTTAGFLVQLGDFYPGDWTEVTLAAAMGVSLQAFTWQLPVGNLNGHDPTHPDAYGYRAFQNTDTAYGEAPLYAWTEIDPAHGGNGTVRVLPDTALGWDTTLTIALPFPFNFYGTRYSQISICSNGFVSFGQTSESFFRNYSLPAIASPDNMVCIFWDNLIVPPGSHICTYYDAFGGRFVVEWSGLRNAYSVGYEETFQLLLYDTTCWPSRTGDGNLLFQYRAWNNIDSWDNYATIGIQDRDRQSALQISYADILEPGVSALGAGQSILFTTGRPSGPYLIWAGNVIDDDNSGGSSGNGDGQPQNGETIELSLRVRNIGTAAAPATDGVMRSTDTFAVLLDSTVTVPAVDVGATVETNALRVQLDPRTAHGASADFVVRLTGNSQPRVILPSFIVLAPVLVVLPMETDDDSVPPSQGNDNGVFNPGETIELIGRCQNMGGHLASGVTAILRRLNTLVTVLDSTADLGTVPVDSQGTASDPFVVRVNTNAHDGDVIPLRVIMRDQAGTQWAGDTSYVVAEALLSVRGVRVDDAPPGGNGDGLLTAGESAGLYPRVHNRGSGGATGVTIALQSFDPNVIVEDTSIQIGAVAAHTAVESAVPIHVEVADSVSLPHIAWLTASISGDEGIQETDSLLLPIGTARFHDDLESDFEQWQVYGSSTAWHIESRQYSSPTRAFYCGDESLIQYVNGTESYLRSPVFSFGGSGVLIYATRYQLGNAGDVCRVHLQLGTSNYRLVDQFTGTHSEWYQRTIPLSGLPSSNSARIRFWFSADGTVNGEGWYVDDVILLDQSSDAPDPRPPLVPRQTGLDPCFPNPFNDRTTISYEVAQRSPVRLSLVDVQGRLVACLIDEAKGPGTYRLSWKPLRLASGMYWLHMEVGGAVFAQKVVYLK